MKRSLHNQTNQSFLYGSCKVDTPINYSGVNNGVSLEKVNSAN